MFKFKFKGPSGKAPDEGDLAVDDDSEDDSELWSEDGDKEELEVFMFYCKKISNKKQIKRAKATGNPLLMKTLRILLFL